MAKRLEAQLQEATQDLERQRRWIFEHGETRSGYVDTYGDPGVIRKNGKLMSGNGGTAIFNADQAELNRLISRVNSIKIRISMVGS